jgi:thioredoxin 1
MSTKTFEVNQAEWDSEVLRSELPVLVELWADWCSPCYMITPIIEEIAEEYAGKLRVATVDTEANPDILTQNGVMSIPALLLFKDGKVVTRLTGFKPKEKIISKIQEYLD